MSEVKQGEVAKIDKSIFKYCASELQRNMMKEADAIMSYQELINMLNNYYVGEMDETNRMKFEKARDKIISTIKEFIEDELNHQETLSKLYTFVTGIKASED